MKPWFLQDAEIIQFPKRKADVVTLPNVNSYPDFITGVRDLQAKLKDKTISTDSYNKLYTDLITRFRTKKEQAETPWFMMEDPARLQDIAKQISSLPDNVESRLLDKIQRAIELARQPEGERDEYKSVSTPLKNIEDADMRVYYREVAKKMLGNNLTGKEISQIINDINNDKIVNLGQLTAVSSDLSKILKYYGSSKQITFFYKDMLSYQPAQGIGPGEILLATMSKSLTKKGKGDLTLADGSQIEVKGGRFEGRFRDRETNPTAEYPGLVQAFLNKYPTKNKSGMAYGELIGVYNQTQNKNEFVKDFTKIINSLFPNNEYTKKIVDAVKKGDVPLAVRNHGIANLKQYFDIKQGKLGVLFINAATEPATTSYVNGFDDIVSGVKSGSLNLNVRTAYVISPKGEQYPKIGITTNLEK